VRHLNHAGDTTETIARALELEINGGYTGVRAEANGSRLTIVSRAMGADGNLITLGVTTAGALQAVVSGPTLLGGADGVWYTDLNSAMKINRAARDWTRSFMRALAAYGIAAVSAFSTELQHGDPRVSAGIAQRYPSGNPVLLNTPALQTNFSPASLAYWKEVHREMAGIMAQAGMPPYLQFGEVQWWYFPYDGTGMPFYDAYTLERFRDAFGRELPLFGSNLSELAGREAEAAFLASLIGEFTDAIMAHVRSTHPECRFELLYPTDVNATPLNQAVNYPLAHWTPEKYDCLKTESFTYTYDRNLDASRGTIRFSEQAGFRRESRSHLVGISDVYTAWQKEAQSALGESLESVVLFALDQFCLIGYDLSYDARHKRSVLAA
jgi:hypothetical protein